MHAAAFDARQAKLLKPGDYLTFEAVPGLRMVASESRRTWVYRYKDPATGLMKQTKLGVWPAMDWGKVQAAWEKARAERGSGVDLVEAKRVARKSTADKASETKRAKLSTCEAVIETYLKEMIEPHRKPKGAREARRMLTRAIAGREGDSADAITPEDAHTIILGIASTAKRVASMTRAELRAAWDYGRSTGRLKGGNPWLGRTIGGKLTSKSKKRKLSAGEAAELLRWMRAPKTYSRTIADALELTLRTGLRGGEIVGMHSREFEHRGGVLWVDIPPERMKMGEAHSAPLLGRAREIVLARMPQGEEGGYLFPSRLGGHIQQKALGVEVFVHSGRSKSKEHAHLERCPVGAWAPHDLRRTARTFLSELGCPFEVGEAILAHELPGVASVYDLAELNAARVLWLGKLNEYLDTLEAEKKVAAIRRSA